MPKRCNRNMLVKAISQFFFDLFWNLLPSFITRKAKAYYLCTILHTAFANILDP